MTNIFSIIDNYRLLIFAAMAILIILLFILVAVCFSAIGKLEKRYRKLTRGVDNKNLEDMIITYMDKIEAVSTEGRQIKDMYSNLDEKLKRCIQKVSLTRYRAFEDVGSDLSFSAALLDEEDNGFILTGIYGRSESTAYAKPVDRGISRYELSSEEQQVLEEAMDNKK